MKKIAILCLSCGIGAWMAVVAPAHADTHEANDNQAMQAAPAENTSTIAPAPDRKEPTPAQREEMKKKMHERLEKMTPAEREEAKQKMHERRKERFDNMSEEDKKAFLEKRRAHREEMKKKWESMSPEERAAAKQKMHERMENMPPEKRKRMEERREKRREKMREHHMMNKEHGEKPAETTAEPAPAKE